MDPLCRNHEELTSTSHSSTIALLRSGLQVIMQHFSTAGNSRTIILPCTTPFKSSCVQTTPYVLPAGNVSFSNFTDNIALATGAGIYASDTSLLNLRGTWLVDNMAASYGGGLGLWSDATANMVRTAFKGNIAAEWGGAVCIGNNSHLEATEVAIFNNTAKYGGGMYVYEKGSANIHDTIVAANGAKSDGGGFYLWDNAVLNFSTSDMSAAWVVANSAANSGGALAAGQQARAYWNGCRFERNTAKERGGVFYGTGNSTITCKDIEMHGGVQQEDCLGGAVLLNDHASITLSSCTVSNYTANRGAGLALYTSAKALAYNTTIEHSQALKSNGGGLYMVHESSVEWHGGNMVHLEGYDGGCVSMGYTTKGSFYNTQFVGCKASSRGGALYLTEDSAAVLMHCRVQAASAIGYGGGLYLRDKAVVNLTSCGISNCSSKSAGGGLIAFDNASISMYGCRVLHNAAAANGAGISFAGASFDAHTSWVINNTCQDKGGGIFAYADGILGLRDCRVLGNAAQAGGGIWLGDTSVLRMPHTKVAGNTASAYGGGIVLQSADFLRSQVDDGVLHNNAKIEPDVAVWPTTITNLNGSTVQNFVSRLNSEEGLVNVTLLVTGAQQLPSQSVTVKASLDGINLVERKSGLDGVVYMPVKLRRPPGEGVGRSHQGMYMACML